MSYHLENIVSQHSRIYQQICQYYHFCEQVRHFSPATMQSKIYTLNNFVQISKLTDLRKISNQHIYSWIESQSRRGNSGRSINDRLAHLRAMLRWQQDMNLPMPYLQLGLVTKAKEAPPRKVCFSRSDITKVLENADLQTWLLIRLAFDCGLRIGEIQKLRLCHLQQDRFTIIGKGNKQRYTYLAPAVLSKLQLWIQQYHITDYFWPSPLRKNQPLAICTLRQKMQAAFTAAGLADFCPHDLRHSYATDLKNLGIPTRQIQAGLGHASESTTERYLSDLDGLDLYEVYQRKYAVENENLTKTPLTIT